MDTAEGKLSWPSELKKRLYLKETKEDEEMVVECMNLCTLFNFTPEDLQYKLEALNFLRGGLNHFDMNLLVELKAKEQQRLEVESANKAKLRANAVHRGGGGGGFAMSANARRSAAAFMNKGVPKGAPRIKVEQDGSVVPMSVSGSVVFQGPKMDLDARESRTYRYMYEKISERGGVLDDRIEEFGEILRDHYKDSSTLQITDYGDPSSSVDEEVIVIGRITHDFDSASSSSKLAEATLTLEPSRLSGGGERVPLAFQTNLHIRGGIRGAGGLGFFPGAIAAFKGKNGGGGKFAVSEIISLPPLKPSPAALGIPNPKIASADVSLPFKLCVAAGPYTHDADLEYESWNSLLQKLKSDKPNALLLLGPFIDTNHSKIKTGKIDVEPQVLFRTKFIDPLRTFLDSSPGTIAILVSSVQDLLSYHVVYPQAELGQELVPRDPRIHLVPNPTTFSLNSITFATTSVDALFHVRKEELIKKSMEIMAEAPASEDDVPADATGNLCRHFFQQRSFYPVFPTPLDLSHEVNLDVSHMDGLRLDERQDGIAPDVLIIPSRLKYFSKAVYHSTVINPSYVNKGMYCIVDVGQGEPGKTLRQRMKVDITKFTG
ncbi:DNA polymerase alpha, subunit B [Pluteus cervinus]|uniref:DNA polymerase alpha, subunit B n=1 Tax=Pluteus cervinus TaxID=181527 RepID=A0ACD3BA95_9AGAR|nr:DNA polymerase alpha, subunit B [Pluteus cervinus]